MNTSNNTMEAKVRNIDVGKAECSIVLTPQAAKDHTFLNRLGTEEWVVEPVTLTDTLEEIEGHDVALRQGYIQGIRIAIRPKQKVAKKATPKKTEPKAE